MMRGAGARSKDEQLGVASRGVAPATFHRLRGRALCAVLEAGGFLFSFIALVVHVVHLDVSLDFVAFVLDPLLDPGLGAIFKSFEHSLLSGSSIP